MTSSLGRGLAAGAVGTSLLNLASYLDMALTDRPASSAPAETVAAAADGLGLDLPDGQNARSALGALGGIGAGLAVGVLASSARALGVRLSGPASVLAAGAAAMAATDVPMAALGVAEPSTWTAADWARDAVPHLAYGLGVRWTLDRMQPPRRELGRPRRVSGGLLARSAGLGLACGARTSLGPAAAALAGGHPLLGAAASTLVVTEISADKSPSAPSRLQAAPTLMRVGLRRPGRCRPGRAGACVRFATRPGRRRRRRGRNRARRRMARSRRGPGVDLVGRGGRGRRRPGPDLPGPAGPADTTTDPRRHTGATPGGVCPGAGRVA